MARDIEELEAALRHAYPDISMGPHAAADSAGTEGIWLVRHPKALIDVQVESTTGDVPFTVESDLAPPTVARSVDRAVRLVIERLGLGIGGA